MATMGDMSMVMVTMMMTMVVVCYAMSNISPVTSMLCLVVNRSCLGLKDSYCVAPHYTSSYLQMNCFSNVSMNCCIDSSVVHAFFFPFQPSFLLKQRKLFRSWSTK